MFSPRTWARQLHLGQLLMVSGILAVALCAAGFGALSSLDKAPSCTSARNYSDSLTTIRSRLRSTDSVLLRFNLAEVSDPAFRQARMKAPRRTSESVVERARRLSLWTSQDIQRNVVALRLVGASASDLRDYLARIENLAEAPAAFTAGAAARQLDAIHAAERDSLYLEYIRETKGISRERLRWHDTLGMAMDLALSSIRCGGYHRQLTGSLALFAVAFGALFATWWWWFGGRR